MRIGIISPSLVQGGAGRFVYEHAIALSRCGHECIIFTASGERSVYIDALRENKIKVVDIFFRTRVVLSWLRVPQVTRLLNCLYSMLEYLYVRHYQCDVYFLIQIETCYRYSCIKEFWDRGVVALLSHQFQYGKNIYHDLRDKVNLYLMDDQQQRELEAAHVNFQGVTSPLSLDVSKFDSKYHIRKGFRIGYFSRMSPERPVEFFFFALHVLKEKYPQVTLHIFGRGCLTLEQRRLLETLGLGGHVTFEGHVKNMLKAIEEKHISMVWLPCYGETLGYAPIELMLYQVPMVLWNLDPKSEHNELYAESSLTKFVSMSEDLMGDVSKATRVAEMHSSYVRRLCDIENNIPKLIRFMELIGHRNLPR